MMPILYSKDETAFTSNGLGRLSDCTRCVVTEERNGVYECEFDYPITGELYSEITEGRIIAVMHDDGHDVQPFDIYGRSAPLGGIVTFYAHHISYRLNNVILKPFTAASCATAMAAMKTSTYNANPFTFWTDKDTSATFTLTHPASVREKLAGQEGSLLDVYGKGEYEFDGWTVRLYASRGNDNGVSIRYGVNLSEMTHTYDEMGVYTAVAPYWVSTEDDTVVMLPEGYVASTKAPVSHSDVWEDGRGGILEDGRGNQMEMQWIDIVPVSLDLSDAFETIPSVTQLRNEALRRLNSSEAWLPDENIRVSFVDLAQTTEYESMTALQRVRLCDKVSVYCGPLGVSAVKMQVIKTVYNTLTETYDEIEIGKPKASFAETIMSSVESAVTAATAGLISGTQLTDAIDNATAMITGARGSHGVLKLDANGGLQEFLMMDTDDINTAVNVWRWNVNGLGFSSNGYSGPYETAITADGSIVASMITSGLLSAAYIDATDLHVSAANVDGTLTANQIGANTISISKLGTDVTTTISNAQSTANGAATAAGNAQTAAGNAQTAADNAATAADNAQTAADNAADAAQAAQSSANGANAETHLIYKSAVSGTTSMAAPSSWITSTSTSQNAWTTVRPVYSSSYPVLFVATQRKAVDGTLSCTTPVVDQTTTVIDGGHITTGSIDAGRITTGTLDASAITVTNLSASSITSGTLSADRVSGGTLTGTTISGDTIEGGSISGTSISNRASTTAGIEIDAYGDVAVGTKPSDMSTFADNACPFQIDRYGRVKTTDLQVWAANSSGVYEMLGQISASYANQILSLAGNNGVRIYNGLDVWDTGLTVRAGGAAITGDTTISGSLTATEFVGLTLTGTTWPALYYQLNAITNGNAMPFACASSITSHLTGSKVSAIVFGTVYRANNTVFEFTARQLNVAYEFAWRVTFSSGGTGATVGTVYRFTGTAI